MQAPAVSRAAGHMQSCRLSSRWPLSWFHLGNVYLRAFPGLCASSVAPAPGGNHAGKPALMGGAAARCKYDPDLQGRDVPLW
jgi:hypothetical protein